MEVLFVKYSEDSSAIKVGSFEPCWSMIIQPMIHPTILEIRCEDQGTMLVVCESDQCTRRQHYIAKGICIYEWRIGLTSKDRTSIKTTLEELSRILNQEWKHRTSQVTFMQFGNSRKKKMEKCQISKQFLKWLILIQYDESTNFMTLNKLKPFDTFLN